MKRLLLWSLLLVVIGLPLALAGLAVLCLDDRPRYTRGVELDASQIERAKRILQAHDPRKMPDGVQRTFAIADQDLELALNYLLSQRGGGAVHIVAQAGMATLRASIPLPPNPFGSYLNVEGIASETSGLPGFEHVRIGRVTIPDFIVAFVFARALERLNETEVGQVAADTIRSVHFSDSRILVEYVWREDVPARLRQALLPPVEQARFEVYQRQLADITAWPQLPSKVSLVNLVVPLFELARKRTEAGENPVLENRTAIVALAFYVSGHGLSAIVPAARDWPRPRPLRVTLSARTDLSQHFSISAALAATAGDPLSDAIGVYKEVSDARGGSGFSFVDLAANRAGTVFGQRATASAAAAADLQRRVLAGIREEALMPPALDLPENLQHAEFVARFGGVGEPAYERVAREIERRIATLTLYR